MRQIGKTLARWIRLCVMALVLSVGTAGAQITEQDVIDTGPRHAGFDAATRWRGIQREVTYLRPAADYKPDDSIRIDIPDPPDAEGDADQIRTIWIAVFFVLTLFVVFMFARYGNAISVSFGDTRERTRAGDGAVATERAAPLAGTTDDQFLESLRRMADRRMALILLVGRALERAADQNGLRLGRAQTARDVVRALPSGWQHLGALRGLVRKAEVVHFGGRPIAEEEWQQCLATAGPLFGRRAA